MTPEPEKLDAAALAQALEAEMATLARDLAVPDASAYRQRVLAFPDVLDILAAWDSVRPEWRRLLAGELVGAARDVANSYKSECLRCGRCCRCQIYLEEEDCGRGSIEPRHVEVLVEGRFAPGETVDDWRSVWESGAVVRLKHQESGTCVFHDDATHLCTIHAARANHCRHFFCFEDIKRRESFSFPDLVQHLGGLGFEPFRIALVFVSLRLWRKVGELRSLDEARRREFAQAMGLPPDLVGQFLGPSLEEQLRQAAAGDKADPALRDYVATWEATPPERG